MAFSTDRDTLYRNLDSTHPDQYLLTDGSVDAKGMTTCFLHVPDGAGVFVAVGRTARYELAKLQHVRSFVPHPRPFIIQRDDGHRIAYG